MLEHIRPSLVMLALFTLLTGIAYPLAMTGICQVLFPGAANGSVVNRKGVAIGSRLIGQAFASERYFHGRPSATTAPDPKDDTKTIDVPYNAASSGGSNLGPISKKLLERIKADADRLQKEAPSAAVPIDAVTASGSGLDPHISPAFARLQVARVAKARGIPEDRVLALVEQIGERRLLGLLGEPRVNVLMLNLALDALTSP
jgi:potassium-transporting ATPase KdpC subunit